MNNKEKIAKLAELRQQVKNLITQYNTITDEDKKLKSKLVLLTYSGAELFTKKQLEESYETGDGIDGEYFDSFDELPVIFSPLAKNWMPSSLTC